MKQDILKIGNKMELVQEIRANKDEAPPRYTSQLLDILEDNYIKAAMPSYQGRIIPLEVGTVYHTFFYTEKGLYRCKCEVTDRYRDQQFFYVILKFITDIEKFQRREYYRMNCTMNTYVRQISKEEEICLAKLRKKNFSNDEDYWKCMAKLDASVKNWKEATIIDISGGGARLNSGTQYEKGEQIYMKLSFMRKGLRYEYELLSKVIVSMPLEQKSGVIETRIEFQTITNRERENIIQFIFEEERRLRQKEMGL